MHVRPFLVSLATLSLFTGLLAGCDGGKDTGTGGGGSGGAGGGGGTGGAPAGNQVAFDTDKYQLKPGDEREYMCFTTRLPEDASTNIIEIEPIYGAGIHHLGIYQTIIPEVEGTFDCPELVRESWLPLYGGGIESGKLTMPEGAALVVPKGAQILVQLHLLNTTGEDIDDKAHIIFHTSDDETLTRAGMFGFDNRDLKIAAHGTNVEQSMACPEIGVEMDVFAVFGHMHQRGKKIEVSRGATAGQDVLYSAKWEFQDQPTVPAKFHVSKDDTVNVSCWYDNPDNQDVGYGESTFDEMCSFVFYYTPFLGLDGCVKAPPQ